MTKPWPHPQDLDSIRLDIAAEYPTLHPFLNKDGLVEVAGLFPVRGAGGELLDTFDISIVLPDRFPRGLPIVREVAGRIPRTADRHVEPDGKACVMLPDDRWRCFPEGSTFGEYLRVPVHNYFLGQSYWEEHGEWPFGEWGHGRAGILEYYRSIVHTEDDTTARRFLYVLTKLNLKTHWDCPCGSGKRIRDCCQRNVTDLRSKIPAGTAKKSWARLGAGASPYLGPKLRGGPDRGTQ